jgi:hypothetical protein
MMMMMMMMMMVVVVVVVMMMILKYVISVINKMSESIGFRSCNHLGTNSTGQHVRYIKFYCCKLYLHYISKSLISLHFTASNQRNTKLYLRILPGSPFVARNNML